MWTPWSATACPWCSSAATTASGAWKSTRCGCCTATTWPPTSSPSAATTRSPRPSAPPASWSRSRPSLARPCAGPSTPASPTWSTWPPTPRSPTPAPPPASERCSAGAWCCRSRSAGPRLEREHAADQRLPGDRPDDAVDGDRRDVLVQGLLEAADGRVGLGTEDPVDLEALAGVAGQVAELELLLDPADGVAQAALAHGDDQRRPGVGTDD